MPLNGTPCQTHAAHAFMTLEERVTALEGGSQSGSVSGSVSWGGITGTLSNQTDLQTALNAKGTSNFSGAYADLSGIPATFTPAAHNQAISTITGLQAALDSKGTSNFSGSYTDLTDKPTLGDSASKNVGTAAGTVAAGDHTHQGGGSDPWTIVALSTDFTTSSATAVDVTGLSFTPAANGRYMFEAVLGIRTATATVNPRIGFAWATGMTDGVAQIDESQTATARLMANGNINAALLVAVGGIPNTTQTWPVTIWGWVKAGAAPSGNIRIQLASETAGTVVRVTAHSYLRFRSY
jgi:hypothetical protein